MIPLTGERYLRRALERKHWRDKHETISTINLFGCGMRSCASSQSATSSSGKWQVLKTQKLVQTLTAIENLMNQGCTRTGVQMLKELRQAEKQSTGLKWQVRYRRFLQLVARLFESRERAEQWASQCGIARNVAIMPEW
jgi:hypothetical protein